jgi:hypothetical protein
MFYKYMETLSIEDSIKRLNKIVNASIIWKILVVSFPMIENWWPWIFGNGNKVRLGIDTTKMSSQI